MTDADQIVLSGREQRVVAAQGGIDPSLGRAVYPGGFSLDSSGHRTDPSARLRRKDTPPNRSGSACLRRPATRRFGRASSIVQSPHRLGGLSPAEPTPPPRGE